VGIDNNFFVYISLHYQRYIRDHVYLKCQTQNKRWYVLYTCQT